MIHTAGAPDGRDRRWSPLRTLLGLLVGGGLLYAVMRDIRLEDLISQFRGISLAWVPPLIFCLLAGFGLRSLRWQRMFPPDQPITYREAFDGFMIGALGNNLLPGRLGDVLRAAIIGRHLRSVGTTGGLATILLEKVLDGIILLGFLGMVLILAPVPSWLLKAGGWAGAVFGAALTILLLLNFWGSRDPATSPATQSRWRNLLRQLLRRFSEGLHGLRSGRRFAELVVFSLLVWGIEILILTLAFRIFGLQLPTAAAMLTLVLLSVGTMLPAAPGFLGSYQFFIVLGLSLYRVPEAQGVAIGLFLNLAVILVTTLVGVAALFAEGGLGSALKGIREPTR